MKNPLLSRHLKPGFFVTNRLCSPSQTVNPLDATMSFDRPAPEVCPTIRMPFAAVPPHLSALFENTKLGNENGGSLTPNLRPRQKDPKALKNKDFTFKSFKLKDLAGNSS